jgi:1-acyl-sn-glycerol-3-phosphate acyltransferase
VRSADGARPRGGRRRIGFWYRLPVVLLRRPLLLLTRRDWRGAEHLPVDTGYVAVVNHISHLDPFTFTHFLFDNGHLPRFLVKESVFRAPVFGWIVRGASQIPVYRESADAAKSYAAAVDAVQRGECVAIYPEGTLTRDPRLWPMRGKTGAARIALATGRPVIPIAQWGAHEMLPPYAHRPRLFPPHAVSVRAGAPVDLSRFAGRELTADVLAEATNQIMDAITALLAEIRREAPPAERWDPRIMGQPLHGNPNRPAGRRADGAA